LVNSCLDEVAEQSGAKVIGFEVLKTAVVDQGNEATRQL